MGACDWAIAFFLAFPTLPFFFLFTSAAAATAFLRPLALIPSLLAGFLLGFSMPDVAPCLTVITPYALLHEGLFRDGRTGIVSFFLLWVY